MKDNDKIAREIVAVARDLTAIRMDPEIDALGKNYKKAHGAFMDALRAYAKQAKRLDKDKKDRDIRSALSNLRDMEESLAPTFMALHRALANAWKREKGLQPSSRLD